MQEGGQQDSGDDWPGGATPTTTSPETSDIDEGPAQQRGEPAEEVDSEFLELLELELRPPTGEPETWTPGTLVTYRRRGMTCEGMVATEDDGPWIVRGDGDRLRADDPSIEEVLGCRQPEAVEGPLTRSRPRLEAAARAKGLAVRNILGRGDCAVLGLLEAGGLPTDDESVKKVRDAAATLREKAKDPGLVFPGGMAD